MEVDCQAPAGIVAADGTDKMKCRPLIELVKTVNTSLNRVQRESLEDLQATGSKFQEQVVALLENFTRTGKRPKAIALEASQIRGEEYRKGLAAVTEASGTSLPLLMQALSDQSSSVYAQPDKDFVSPSKRDKMDGPKPESPAKRHKADLATPMDTDAAPSPSPKGNLFQSQEHQEQQLQSQKQHQHQKQQQQQQVQQEQTQLQLQKQQVQQQQEQHRLQEQKRQQMLQQKQQQEQPQKQQPMLKQQQEQEQLLQRSLSNSDLTDNPGKSPMRIRTTPGKNVSEKILALEKKLNAPTATAVSTTPGAPTSARSNPPNSARSNLPTGNSVTPTSVSKTASATSSNMHPEGSLLAAMRSRGTLPTTPQPPSSTACAAITQVPGKASQNRGPPSARDPLLSKDPMSSSTPVLPQSADMLLHSADGERATSMEIQKEVPAFPNLASGPSMQNGIRGPDGKVVGQKPVGAEAALDRMTEGRRQEVAKPKSLKAAEQAKMLEEKRQAEKKEKERQRWQQKQKQDELNRVQASAKAPGEASYPSPKPSPVGEAPHALDSALTPCSIMIAPNATAAKKGEREMDKATGHTGKSGRRSATMDVECMGFDQVALGLSENTKDSVLNTPRQGKEGKKPRPPVPVYSPQPKATPLEQWMLLRQQPIGDPRPEDNYEISEKGDDSEAESPEDNRKNKHVPEWCKDWITLLNAQADIDPDSIFGTKVPRCELEAIFTDEDYAIRNKKRPRRKRGSSGEWKKDRLTQFEIDEYKRKMGQTKIFDVKMKRKI